MKKIKNILIIGPQGSGKDTQSERLAKKRRVPFIVMGDLFRQEIRKESSLGQKVASLVKEGQLTSDNISAALIGKRLKHQDVKRGFILNGFPRTLKQALILKKMAAVNLVLELWISDQESLRRLAGRRFCPKCGKTFHLRYQPSKKKNVCDYCGGRLITREDDKEPVIKRRLKIYHQQTEPILKYYKKNGRYLKINGEQSIPAVFAEMIKKIKTKEK